MLQAAGRPASAGPEAGSRRADRKKAAREAREARNGLDALADEAERAQATRALEKVGGRV